MNNYTNYYERPDWIKKECTSKMFDKFEELLSNGDYTIDFHWSEHHGRYFYSYYLIPKGQDLSYYGHPEGTIRLANHWSWYTSYKNCTDLNRVQCELKGIKPRLRFEDKPTGATTPKYLTTIAIVKNGIYVPLKY
jgi:hypothetical protein